MKTKNRQTPGLKNRNHENKEESSIGAVNLRNWNRNFSEPKNERQKWIFLNGGKVRFLKDINPWKFVKNIKEIDLGYYKSIV